MKCNNEEISKKYNDKKVVSEEIVDKTNLLNNLFFTFNEFYNENRNKGKDPNAIDFFKLNIHRCEHGSMIGYDINCSIKSCACLYNYFQEIYSFSFYKDENDPYNLYDVFRSYCNDEELNCLFGSYDIDRYKDRIINQFKNDILRAFIDMNNCCISAMEYFDENPIIHIEIKEGHMTVENFDEFYPERFCE